MISLSELLYRGENVTLIIILQTFAEKNNKNCIDTWIIGFVPRVESWIPS
jgi:hypothetical protein